MARNTYGLDLGSYEIKVYDKKKDTIWKEKDVIAIKDGTEIFAVGDDAYGMYEKAPDNINVVFPMKEGVISHFNDMQFLLQNLLKKGRQFARGSEYVIAVPTDVTEVEKKAFFDLVIHSTAKALFLLLLAGIVLGGFIGMLADGVSSLNWLSYGQTFGLDDPVVLNLGLLVVTFGLTIKITIASIIGVIVAIFIYRFL